MTSGVGYIYLMNNNAIHTLLPLNNAMNVRNTVGVANSITFEMSDDDVLQLITDAKALDMKFDFTLALNGTYTIAL